MIFRKGGMRATSFWALVDSSTIPSPPASGVLGAARTVSHMKMVESAATVTRREVLQVPSAGMRATSVMPSVCPQSLAMSDPCSVYSRTDLSELATPAIAGLPFSDGAYKTFDMTAASPPSASEHLKLVMHCPFLIRYLPMQRSTVAMRSSSSPVRHIDVGEVLTVIARSMTNATDSTLPSSRNMISRTTIDRSAECVINLLSPSWKRIPVTAPACSSIVCCNES